MENHLHFAVCLDQQRRSDDPLLSPLQSTYHSLPRHSIIRPSPVPLKHPIPSTSLSICLSPPLPLPLHYIPVWDRHKQLLTLMDTKIIKGETCVGACHNQSEELKSSWVMDHGLLFLHLVEVLPVPLKGEGWGSGRVGESWGRGQLERRYIGGFYKDTQAHGTG